MVVIDPQGMFQGERIAQLSDQAKLFWPWFFLSSNGFGRIEVNYRKFRTQIMSGFNHPLTEKEYLDLVKEYSSQLLFLYQYGTQLWGQWDTSAKWLPRHKTAHDKRSPAPKHASFLEWKDAAIHNAQAPFVSTFSEMFGALSQSQPDSGQIGTFPGPSEMAHRDVPEALSASPLPSTFSENFGNVPHIVACSCSCSCIKEREEELSLSAKEQLHQPAEKTLSLESRNETPSPILESDWIEFREKFTKTSSQPSTEMQWVIAHSIWRRLDFGQRLEAMAYLKPAQAADMWKVTRATAKSYLEGQVWTLPIPAPAKGSTAKTSKPVVRLYSDAEIRKQKDELFATEQAYKASPEGIAARKAEDEAIEKRKLARKAALAKMEVTNRAHA